jgi:hypothetical protein
MPSYRPTGDGADAARKWTLTAARRGSSPIRWADEAGRFALLQAILPNSRFSGYHATGSAFDFGGPCGFNLGDVFASDVIQAREQLSGHVGALVDRQRQCFTKNLLRSGRHAAILGPAGQPNKRRHPSAACFLCSRG